MREKLIEQKLVRAVGTFIRFLAFTEYIIKNLRYSIRMIIFIVPFSVLLTACAVGFYCFPSEITGAWIMFIVIFILAFIGITIGFEIYFSVTEKKYDGLLGEYKKQKDKKK